MRVKTSLNVSLFDPLQEQPEGVSLTVPDQTMTVREILERFAKGLPIGAGKVPLYDEDDELPDPRYLDLTERQELTEQAKQEIARVVSRRKAKVSSEKGEAEAKAAAAPPSPSNEQAKRSGAGEVEEKGGAEPR